MIHINAYLLKITEERMRSNIMKTWASLQGFYKQPQQALNKVLMFQRTSQIMGKKKI